MATGSGTSTYVGANTPSVADGKQARVTVVAGNLGECDNVPTYRSVAWYFPDEGETLDPARLASSNICVPPETDCKYTLNVRAEPVSDELPEQHRLKIVLTNRSIATCDVSGHLRAQLTGAPLQPGEPDTASYKLPDQTGEGVRAATARLRFTESAHAIVTFLPPDPSETKPWLPEFISVGPPDKAGDIATLAWTWGPVLRQDAATHPGTYIGPTAVGEG
jgi:hypothetical protein